MKGFPGQEHPVYRGLRRKFDPSRFYSWVLGEKYGKGHDQRF